MDANKGQDDRIDLTKAVRAQLRSERDRTGVTAIQLLSDADDVPDGLTPGIVNRWMNGLIRSAPRQQFAYVIDRWAGLPDAPGQKRGKAYPTSAPGWIEVTDAMAAQLRAELVRTGMDRRLLLSGATDMPDGLTLRIVTGWLYRHAKTTRCEHWDYVVARLAAMPDLKMSLPLNRRNKAD